MTEEASSTGSDPQKGARERRARILRSGIRRLDRRWRDRSEEPRGALRAALAPVVRAVRQIDVAPPNVEHDDPGELVLRRAVLDELRGVLLEGTDGVGVGTEWHRERLGLLRRLEAVRVALEPTHRGRFADALIGPHGLGLALGVTHDLRSPLTSILFLSDALRSGSSGRLNDLQRRQVELLHSAGRSMLSLVNDVVDASAPTPERAEEVEPFFVEEVLRSVADLVAPIAEAKALELRLAVPELGVRRGRPLELGRVVLNLATNAARFTDDGFVEIRARATGPSSVRFWVRDTGRGLPPGMKQKLSLPFRTMPGGRGYRFSSSGLGLTIVCSLLDLMGSTLEVETWPGEGTTFSFSLELPVRSVA